MSGLGDLFSTDTFMPHGMCYEWNPSVIALHVASDGLIALSYYSIPLTLVYFVRRRKDLAFDWMFLCFAAFIVACGTTHLMEIYNIWHPVYWLSGAIKLITAAFSVVTAILLIRLVPAALALPSPAQLRLVNETLQHEIEDRTAAVEHAESLNNKLIGQTAQLEEANHELEAFTYSVSHDLRAPLRHIDGFVDLLRAESELNKDGARYAKVISDSARQMGTLIDDLLAFSRTGRSALQPKWVKMDELVEEARTTLAPEEKDRTVAWSIAALPSVFADGNLLRQVWINLLGNALKYSRSTEHPEIIVGYRQTEREYEFFVKDNGAGFDMKYADKLFGIFQRLHLKEEFEGTGIGLANVRRIVARHGGRTWGEGKLGIGATFFFTLPIQSPLSESP
jgi:signal transduction histidine kinase